LPKNWEIYGKNKYITFFLNTVYNDDLFLTCYHTDIIWYYLVSVIVFIWATLQNLDWLIDSLIHWFIDSLIHLIDWFIYSRQLLKNWIFILLCHVRNNTNKTGFSHVRNEKTWEHFLLLTRIVSVQFLAVVYWKIKATTTTTTTTTVLLHSSQSEASDKWTVCSVKYLS